MAPPSPISETPGTKQRAGSRMHRTESPRTDTIVSTDATLPADLPIPKDARDLSRFAAQNVRSALAERQLIGTMMPEKLKRTRTIDDTCVSTKQRARTAGLAVIQRHSLHRKEKLTAVKESNEELKKKRKRKPQCIAATISCGAPTMVSGKKMKQQHSVREGKQGSGLLTS